MESGLNFHLTVVGEVWQGYRQPLDELAGDPAAGPTRAVVDRYVADDEVPSFFAAADLVVLPLPPRFFLWAVAHRDGLRAAGRDHVGRSARRDDRRAHRGRARHPR